MVGSKLFIVEKSCDGPKILDGKLEKNVSSLR